MNFLGLAQLPVAVRLASAVVWLPGDKLCLGEETFTRKGTMSRGHSSQTLLTGMLAGCRDCARVGLQCWLGLLVLSLCGLAARPPRPR